VLVHKVTFPLAYVVVDADVLLLSVAPPGQITVVRGSLIGVQPRVKGVQHQITLVFLVSCTRNVGVVLPSKLTGVMWRAETGGIVAIQPSHGRKSSDKSKNIVATLCTCVMCILCCCDAAVPVCVY